MEINSTNNKFDKKVKDVLTNYEADFNSTDWGKLERKLDLSSSSKSFNYKYIGIAGVSILFIGLLVFIFNSLNTNSPINTETNTVEEPIKENTIEQSYTEAESLPISDSISIDSITLIAAETPIDESEVISEKTKEERNLKNTTSPVAEIENNSDNAANNKSVNEDNDPETIYTMGNEPVFGDMLDSTKGIVGSTKEKEETKKAAKTTTEIPVGWNTFKPTIKDSVKKK